LQFSLFQNLPFEAVNCEANAPSSPDKGIPPSGISDSESGAKPRPQGFFGLLGFHFILFSPFEPSFPFLVFSKSPWSKFASKMVISSKQIQPKNCLQKWSFWPFGASFPYILTFWAFILAF